jgi:hypothetical protein
MVMIGVLENIGNSHLRKEHALREAQKTADTLNFVNNLRAVKALKYNHPVLNPDPQYIVRESSAAIVLETRSLQGLEGGAV